MPPLKLVEANVNIWPMHDVGIDAFKVPNVIVLPTTSTLELPVPVQPLPSVTVAVYLNVDVPTVAPAIVAVVTLLLVEDDGLTVVVPGDVTTVLVHA